MSNNFRVQTNERNSIMEAGKMDSKEVKFGTAQAKESVISKNSMVVECKSVPEDTGKLIKKNLVRNLNLKKNRKCKKVSSKSNLTQTQITRYLTVGDPQISQSLGGTRDGQREKTDIELGENNLKDDNVNGGTDSMVIEVDGNDPPFINEGLRGEISFQNISLDASLAGDFNRYSEITEDGSISENFGLLDGMTTPQSPLEED